MLKPFASLMSGAAMAGALAAAAQAQSQPASPPPAAAPATDQVSVADQIGPISKFKHPGPQGDLSGKWKPQFRPPPVKSAVGTSGAARSIDDEPIPLKADASNLYWHRIDMEQRGSPVANTAATCRPGVPTSIFSGFLSPFEIIQTPSQVVFAPELGDTIWAIRLDRDHPKTPRPTYRGDWVGHFEGSTLVADGRGFNRLTWLDAIGLPHSEQLHMLVRIAKVNEGTGLRVVITIDDPLMFSKPWTQAFTAEYRPDMTMYEIHCLENVRKENNENLVYEDVKPVPGVNN